MVILISPTLVNTLDRHSGCVLNICGCGDTRVEGEGPVIYCDCCRYIDGLAFGYTLDFLQYLLLYRNLLLIMK